MKKNISTCTDSNVRAKTHDHIKSIVRYRDKLIFAHAMANAMLDLMDLSKTNAEAALDYFLVHLAEMQNAKYPYKPEEDWCWIASQEAANAYALRYNFEPYLCADSDKERNVAGMTAAFIDKQASYEVCAQLPKDFVEKVLDNIAAVFPQTKSMKLQIMLPDIYTSFCFIPEMAEEQLSVLLVIPPDGRYQPPSAHLFMGLSYTLFELMKIKNDGCFPDGTMLFGDDEYENEASQFEDDFDEFAYVLSKTCWPSGYDYDFPFGIEECEGGRTPSEWIDAVKHYLDR